MQTEPVLFLDMDGVVLHGDALHATGNNRHIPPEKIALVREVCERTGCRVVVSSTWRFSDETRDLLLHHGIPLHPDWRTDCKADMVGSILIGQQRGVEIFRWLAKHSNVNYAIIDDDSDMIPEQLPRFVRTRFSDGIERHHVEQLVAILAKKEAGDGR